MSTLPGAGLPSHRRKPVHLFDRGSSYPGLPEPDLGFPVSTTPGFENRRIAEYLGLVSGEAIIGANFFRNVAAAITSVVGGRSGKHEETLAVARDVALAEAIDEAKRRGGSALVGVDLDYEHLGGLLLVCVSGTAVRLE